MILLLLLYGYAIPFLLEGGGVFIIIIHGPSLLGWALSIIMLAYASIPAFLFAVAHLVCNFPAVDFTRYFDNPVVRSLNIRKK